MNSAPVVDTASTTTVTRALRWQPAGEQWSEPWLIQEVLGYRVTTDGTQMATVVVGNFFTDVAVAEIFTTQENTA